MQEQKPTKLMQRKTLNEIMQTQTSNDAHFWLMQKNTQMS